MRTKVVAMLAACSVVLTTLATGCTSNADPVPGPGPDPDPGSMQVTVTSSGSGLDPDGYELAVGAQQPQHIGRFGQVSLTELAPGAYNLLISGLDESQQCRVTGWNPRTITVASGQEVKVSIGVYCGINSGTDPNFGRLPPAPVSPPGPSATR